MAKTTEQLRAAATAAAEALDKDPENAELKAAAEAADKALADAETEAEAAKAKAKAAVKPADVRILVDHQDYQVKQDVTQIGRQSCRERVCKEVKITVDGSILK